ncbi:MAG: hypothetical protein ACR2HG_02345 [Pyrinomonadaceae bacterium]
MKKNKCFELLLLLLLLTVCFSNNFAQRKTSSKTAAKNKPVYGSTLKETLGFISGNLKSEVSYLDSKESATCPTQTTKKTAYEQAVFTNSILDIKLKDEIKRTVCSLNLTNNENISSTSEASENTQISIPLKDLDSSAIKSGTCVIDKGFQRKEGNCFYVSLETLYGKKSIKIDKSSSFKFNDKQVEEAKTISFTTNQCQMYFTDEATADNMAQAFAQAIKLSGGK